MATMATNLDEQSDEDLFLAYNAGEAECLIALLRRKKEWISSVARRVIRDPYLAEDAVQEALIKVYQNASSFKGESKVNTWLYRVVTNTCIDLLRKTEKYSYDTNLDMIGSEAVSVTSEVELKIESSDLYEALEAIPTDQKIAIVLVNIEGYSVDEASKILQVSPGTIKSRCARGRVELKALLEKKPAKDGNQE
jgi:RNA polymerase sigma-70 factor (ECF subfamily)